MRILIACEFSGVVRRAFRDRGHDAWSCDLEPAEDNSEFHIQGDCLPILDQGWDMMIGHPPCDHLSLSGARWCTDHWVKRKKGNHWHDGSLKRKLRDEAAEFFRKLWSAPIERICLENPMSMASSLVCKRTQEIHPWQFGHPEQKTTWLWLKNLPPLVPTNNVYSEMMKLPVREREKIWSMTPGSERKRERSRTFTGIAEAMAEQWGNARVDTPGLML